MNKINLKNEEKIVLSMRSLYQQYGYKQYKMSKFEEYDLYLRNKDFLVSDNIITFTDTDGKLMALKPDVTLSIVKNTSNRDLPVQKVCYNENVYRISKGTHSFKEIMQTGLECMGKIDDYTTYEVIMLAAKSLETISSEYVIDISDVSIMGRLIDSATGSASIKKQILKCIGEKNIHGLSALESHENIDLSKIKKLVSAYGAPDEIIEFLSSVGMKTESERMINIVHTLEQNVCKNKIRIDFSITGNSNYYNGLVFKGFIKGIPESVLSGGQYDNLMKRMGRDEKAIGFAVYLDMLERLPDKKADFDVDTVIIYEPSVDIGDVGKEVNKFTDKGMSVIALCEKPKKIKYRQLVKLTEKGVEILENNA